MNNKDNIEMLPKRTQRQLLKVKGILEREDYEKAVFNARMHHFLGILEKWPISKRKGIKQ